MSKTPTRRTAVAAPATFEGLESRRLMAASGFDGPGLHGSGGGSGGGSDGPSVASGPTEPLKVYSWDDWDIEGVVPMVWTYTAYHTPQEAADHTLPELLSRPADERVVFLKHIGDEFTDRTLADVVRRGLNSNPDQDWVEEYFGLLHEAGVTPSFVVLEYEEGVSTWQRPVAEIKAVMGDQNLRSLLPAALQRFGPDDFDYSGNGRRWREATTAWNDWATKLNMEGLRDAVADPARDVFGQNVPVSNYGDMRPATAVYDINGWALNPGGDTSVAGWSSPSLYLGAKGQLYERYSDPAWANFVSNMNTVRSVVAGGGPVAPWVSNSAYGGNPDLWAEQLRQIRASGVNTMLLWNAGDGNETPEQLAQDIEFTRRAFEEVFAMTTFGGGTNADSTRGPLRQMELDTPTVETAGYGIVRDTGVLTRPKPVPAATPPAVQDMAATPPAAPAKPLARAATQPGQTQTQTQTQTQAPATQQQQQARPVARRILIAVEADKAEEGIVTLSDAVAVRHLAVYEAPVRPGHFDGLPFDSDDDEQAAA